MRITKNAVAGTLESGDILVEILPGQGLEIDLSSIVINQFGDDIRKTIREVIREMDVQDARILANDRGALDCVIRARLETALLRAGEGDTP
ncbi:MAG: citrate lyase acyl carrier protein [Spirochaetales bacterium]|jgi:citrate lyase subunit gamma (acyl carrier protein)|nr:citrate lyase acyl carrier protein [Spirochaetales bacterium]